MKISKLAILFVILAIAITGIHCKKSEDPTEPGDVNFDGTWVANANTPGTKMVYDASESNPVLLVDVVPMGATLSITVVGDNYSLILVEPGEDPIPDTGTFAVNGDQMTLTSDDPEEDVLTFTWSLDGDMLTLRSEDVYFPGSEIPAKLMLVLKKIS
jgi:hypothetical protein